MNNGCILPGVYLNTREVFVSSFMISALSPAVGSGVT